MQTATGRGDVPARNRFIVHIQRQDIAMDTMDIRYPKHEIRCRKNAIVRA
jgi:hypothetical protein